MRDEPVQIIVVGCGAVSQMLYTPALQVLEQAREIRIAGLIDPSEQQRAEMQKSFPAAVSFTDLAACPLNPNTLVIIASPPKLHAEQSVFALERGAAVLCEKPMASSSAEAESMLKAARESRAILAVGLYRRFFPAAEALKDIFEKKPFGNLQNFTVQEGGKFGWGAVSDSFFRRDLTVGGVFYDIGVYVIDLLLWLLGEPAGFTYQDDAMGGVEANCLLEMMYSDNARGTIRLSRDWETQNRYVFVFEKATIVFKVGDANQLNLSIDGVPFVLGGHLTSASTKSINGADGLATRTNLQSFTEQLRNVVGAIKGRQPLRVSGEDGIRSLRFIEECYGKRTLMEMPWLTEAERSTAEILAVDNL